MSINSCRQSLTDREKNREKGKNVVKLKAYNIFTTMIGSFADALCCAALQLPVSLSSL